MFQFQTSFDIRRTSSRYSSIILPTKTRQARNCSLTVNKMETLPAELILQIIDHVQELPTLSALVHASPVFHRVYAAHRAELLTKITLRSLEARGVLFPEPVSWAEVCFTDGESAVLPLLEEADSLRFVLKEINLQLESKRRSRMVFSVDECLILRKILHITTYSVGKNIWKDGSGLGRTCTVRNQYALQTTPSVDTMWESADKEGRSMQYPCGVYRYCLIVVADFPDEHRRELSRRMTADQWFSRTRWMTHTVWALKGSRYGHSTLGGHGLGKTVVMWADSSSGYAIETCLICRTRSQCSMAVSWI